MIAKTEQFLAVLKDPDVDEPAKARPLKFVFHFVADLHRLGLEYYEPPRHQGTKRAHPEAIDPLVH
ncbi:MAG: hypothetical protein ABSD79_01815 [Dehalococcoidales bacterium]